MDWSGVKYFKREEFVCKCCGQEDMDEWFVLEVDGLRGYLKIPLEIVSGYRCLKHDEEEGGKGNHPTGKAVDIECKDSTTRLLILQRATQRFRRIGIGKTFIHLDQCHENAKLEKVPEDVLWLYP